MLPLATLARGIVADAFDSLFALAIHPFVMSTMHLPYRFLLASSDLRPPFLPSYLFL